ncbi:hypothetical protein F5Y13DRAFT_140435 [Hypoxylon sp. FL1857]|nr:hypothetical protein F5Y13DRAFT_140435 [Hypoxylon sp. FL1857]
MNIHTVPVESSHEHGNRWMYGPRNATKLFSGYFLLWESGLTAGRHWEGHQPSVGAKTAGPKEDWVERHDSNKQKSVPRVRHNSSYPPCVRGLPAPAARVGEQVPYAAALVACLGTHDASSIVLFPGSTRPEARDEKRQGRIKNTNSGRNMSEGKMAVLKTQMNRADSV